MKWKKKMSTRMHVLNVYSSPVNHKVYSEHKSYRSRHRGCRPRDNWSCQSSCGTRNVNCVRYIKETIIHTCHTHRVTKNSVYDQSYKSQQLVLNGYCTRSRIMSKAHDDGGGGIFAAGNGSGVIGGGPHSTKNNRNNYNTFLTTDQVCQ